MPTLGGPTALGQTTAALDTVYSYGNSSLRQGITLLSPKIGKSLGASGGGWTHLVYTVTPGIPGDSGSGFMDAQGRAFGVLSTLQLAPVAASNGVSDLPKALAYARAHGGPDVTLASRHRAVHGLDHRLSREFAGLTALRRGKYIPMRVALPRRRQPMFTSQSLRAVAKAGLAGLPRASARRRGAPDRRPGGAERER